MSRSTFRSVRFFQVVLLLVLPCQQLVPAQFASGVKTLQRTSDPVVIAGDKLSQLSGKDIDSIRVFSFRNGELQAVPFQIDQRNSTGCWVWDVVYRKPFVFDDEDNEAPVEREPVTRGPGTEDDEDPAGTALLDANDELVFMAEDLGDRTEITHLVTGAAVILELEVSDTTDGTSAWAYVVLYREAPPPRSARRYMQYNAAGHKVHSPTYSFHFSDTHMAMIHDLQVNDFKIVDRIRVKGELTLSRPFPKRPMKFTEEDIQGYTEGYIAGPVRIIKRNIAHLSLAGGLVSAPEVTCDHFYYARHIEIPVCLSIQFPIKTVAMTLTTDYRNPPFQRLYMGEAREVDAVQDSNGRSLWSRLRQLGTEWIALDSHEASLISLMVVPDTLAGFARAQPCLCPGNQVPVRTRASAGTPTETGFLITSSAECPKGEHILYGSYLISAQPYEPGDEDAALKLQHHKLQIYVSPVQPGG